MVHVTDMKSTTLTEQVADDYEQLGKQGRFSKKCIPRGYIPDLDWTTRRLGPTHQASKTRRGSDGDHYNPAVPERTNFYPTNTLHTQK